MNRNTPLLAFAATAAIALFAAACGSSGSTGLYGSAPSATTAAPATAKVGVGTTGLGHVVVNSTGRTVYLFAKDTTGQSMCSGTCASYWPPVITTGKPLALKGANKSLVGTIKRADGSDQVTYAGHPLYLYQGDQQAGQASGEGLTDFGAAWDALTPAGGAIEPNQG